MVISRDTFDPAKQYRRIRFHEDRQLLDSELNELQEIQNLERSKLADQIFAEGAIVQGCAVSIGGAESHVLTIDPGQVYIGGHIEPVATATLEYDPAKTIGEDFVYAELIKTTIDLGQDGGLLNPRTLEPTAEREQWITTLLATDPSGEPLPSGATERVVVPVLIFDREAGTVRPVVPRSLVQLDHLADAEIVLPQDGQILRYDGARLLWRNTGLPQLTELADVEAPAPGDRQLLRYDEASGQWVHSDENTDADTVDGIHASVTPEIGKLLPLNENAKFPPEVIEGSVASAVNSDKVDGFHASAAPTANTILPLDGNARIPGNVISGQVPDSAHADQADLASQATEAGNADTVDSYHVNSTPTANTLLPLDGDAKIPGSVISGQVPDSAHADNATQAGNADTVDGFHASLTPAANTIVPFDSLGSFNLEGRMIRNIGRFQVGNLGMFINNAIGNNSSDHDLESSTDLLISGRLEVDNQAHFDGPAYFHTTVDAKNDLIVRGDLSGYRCLMVCGHKDANTLNSGTYRNLQSPMGIYQGTAQGIYMPRSGSVTGLMGRFDLVSASADSNLRLEIVSYPSWTIEPIDLPDSTIQNAIHIGQVYWPRSHIPFSAGDHIWLRLYQAGPAGSSAQIQNLECVVEVTFH